MGNYPITPILAQVTASKLWKLLFDDISALVKCQPGAICVFLLITRHRQNGVSLCPAVWKVNFCSLLRPFDGLRKMPLPIFRHRFAAFVKGIRAIQSALGHGGLTMAATRAKSAPESGRIRQSFAIGSAIAVTVVVLKRATIFRQVS